MDTKPKPGDELIAEVNALKLLFASLVDGLLLHGKPKAVVAQQLESLHDFALRSADGLNWRDVTPERAEMLRELTRGRITAFCSTVANPLPDPKARPTRRK
jgi:hypothetical protein